MVTFVESRALALDGLLDHRAPDLLVLVPLVGERLDGLQDQVEGFLPAFGFGAARRLRRRAAARGRRIRRDGRCRGATRRSRAGLRLLCRRLPTATALLFLPDQVVVVD